VGATLKFREVMSGYVGFGSGHLDYEAGESQGKRAKTPLRIEATVAIDDVDRFIADPRHRAMVRGRIVWPALGPPAAIEQGWFELFPDAETDKGRMLYRLWFSDAAGAPLTLRGVKFIGHDPGYDAWRDTTTLFCRVLPGHVGGREDQATAEDRMRTIATGVARITVPAFLKQLTTFRSKARGPLSELATILRFGALFTGQLWRWYVPHPFPDELSVPAPPPKQLGDVPEQFRAADGRTIELEREDVEFKAGKLTGHLSRVRSKNGRAANGPVLLIAGTSVPANIFEAPIDRTIVQSLVEAGYDVFIETWRGSASENPNQFTLEQAAVADHRAAVAKVLEKTKRDKLKAVVHCQGSTSFMMALACGLLPEVTHVVSNAVSLHPAVPPRAELKLRGLGPIVAWLSDYLDPQAGRWGWGITDGKSKGKPPLDVARSLVLPSFVRVWVALTHHECDSMVCKFASFIYGEGGSVMWSHANISEETHNWLADEFFWVPTLFFRQIGRSVMARRLVPLRVLDDVQRLTDLDLGPDTDAKITFMTGLENNCFAPSSQLMSYRYFTAWNRAEYEYLELPGYGHLDVWFGKHAATEVFPKVIEALDG
jgi:hypothetical protein